MRERRRKMRAQWRVARGCVARADVAHAGARSTCGCVARARTKGRGAQRAGVGARADLPVSGCEACIAFAVGRGPGMGGGHLRERRGQPQLSQATIPELTLTIPASLPEPTSD